MFAQIHFTTKAAAVLHSYFDYDQRELPGPLKKMFRDMCKEIRRGGGNEFDAAGNFIIAMANSMFEPKEHKLLLIKWIRLCQNMTPRMTVRYCEEMEENISPLLERLT